MNRRLYRSPSDRVLAGVAGGMAETYDMDPAVVRIAWALLTLLTGGLLLILYIVIVLVVPLRPEGEPPPYSAAMGEPDMSTQTGAGAPIGAPGASPSPPAEVGGNETWRTRAADRRATSDSTSSIVIGAILILIGAYFLMRQFIPALNPALFWPVLVIIGGVLLIAAAVGRRK